MRRAGETWEALAAIEDAETAELKGLARFCVECLADHVQGAADDPARMTRAGTMLAGHLDIRQRNDLAQALREAAER